MHKGIFGQLDTVPSRTTLNDLTWYLNTIWIGPQIAVH